LGTVAADELTESPLAKSSPAAIAATTRLRGFFRIITDPFSLGEYSPCGSTTHNLRALPNDTGAIHLLQELRAKSLRVSIYYLFLAQIFRYYQQSSQKLARKHLV
jgi:hypothetical protein